MSRTIQHTFLESILQKFQKKSEAVDALSGLLNIGKDGVYRRLRGDTYLTPEEIALLAKTYKVSFDALVFQQSDLLLFTYNMMSKKINNYFDYASQLNHSIDQVLNMVDTRLSYATHEIPLFQYFLFPELTAFKLYVYGITSWNFDFLKDRSFSFDLIPQPTLDLTAEIGRKYNLLSSRELWTVSVVDNTLNQLKYLLDIDKFANRGDAQLICDRLLDLINHTKKMASKGKKFGPGLEPTEKNADYELFYNEFASTNNTILVHTRAGKLLFTTFGNPNYLNTTDQALCEEYESWYNALINNSTSLSTGRSREAYFNTLEKKTNEVRSRIN
ncbi:MAG: hypothetical protein AAGG75_17665 [Bacteroidota bacterium]